MKKSIILFFVSIASICMALTVQAEDWVDDWFNQSTYSRPNTYNTQKRGYVTGGNLSLRYRQSADHLVSISPPRFKKGCGGIDLFTGSMSYLNAERLEQKFNDIMSAGIATYAFDLALNVLCEPCAKELKSLEQLIDRINQLQIDDCKATKAVVAVAEEASGFGDSEKTTEAITDFLVSTTGSDYRDVTDSSKGKNVNQVMSDAGQSKSSLVEHCPDAITDIFFTEGTLLENLANRIGIDAGKVELMRAMVGDVYISNNLEYGAIAPCPQNNPTNIDAIIYGDFYARRNGACVNDQINIGGQMFPSIFDWARENLIQIADAMVNRDPLTAENELFINTIPHPVLVEILAEIAVQSSDFEAVQTAERHAYGASIIFARSLMRDLYNDLYNMLGFVRVASFNQTAGSTQCAVSLSSKAQIMANEMRDRVLKYATMINTDYQAAIAGVMESSEYANLIRETSEEAKTIPLKKVYE